MEYFARETFGLEEASFHVIEFLRSHAHNEFGTYQQGDSLDSFMHEDPDMLVIYDVQREMVHMIKRSNIEPMIDMDVVKITGKIDQRVIGCLNARAVHFIDCHILEPVVVRECDIRSTGKYGQGVIRRF